MYYISYDVSGNDANQQPNNSKHARKKKEKEMGGGGIEDVFEEGE